MTAEQLHLGLDIGGTRTRAVAVGDDPLMPVASASVPTRGGVAGVRGSIIKALSVLDAQFASPRSFSTAGIGIAGVVDQPQGMIQVSGNLRLSDVPLSALTDGILSCSCVLDNDVKAAAIGAHLSCGRPPTMTYVNVGTGISAATFLDGCLVRGWRGRAGELGHIAFDSSGTLCACGQRGCLETLAGGANLKRRLAAARRTACSLEGPGADPAHVIQWEAVKAVTTVVLTAVLAYDPQVIVLGGGLGGQAWLLRGLVEELGRRAQTSPLLTALDVGGRTRHIPGELGALGAAELGRRAALPDSPSRTGTPLR